MDALLTGLLLALLDLTAAAPDRAWQVSKEAACEGKEVRFRGCHARPCDECQPMDCRVRAWSDWSAGDCTGLCMRERGILHPSNECGRPCSTSLIETKRCPMLCDRPPDCPKARTARGRTGRSGAA